MAGLSGSILSESLILNPKALNPKSLNPKLLNPELETNRGHAVKWRRLARAALRPGGGAVEGEGGLIT